MNRPPARHAGFTLVEVLVALALLALLAVIAWRGLEHVIAQRARVDADTIETDRVLRTLAQLERDVAQRVPDALFAGRYGAGGGLPLACKFAADNEGRERIEVLRTYPDAHGARRVAYWLEGARLMRELSDPAGERELDRVAMLDAVREIEIRVLVDGQWVQAHLLRASASRARAIRFTIERDDGTRYVQMTQL